MNTKDRKQHFTNFNIKAKPSQGHFIRSISQQQRAFLLFNSMSFLGYYGTSEVSILHNALRIDLDDVLASIMKLSSLIPTRLEILK